MPAQAANVGSFDHEPSRQFTSDRSVKHVRIRCLKLIVEAPIDCKRAIRSSLWWSYGECSWRAADERLPSAIGCGRTGGNRKQACIPRSAIDGLHTCGVLDIGGQAE